MLASAARSLCVCVAPLTCALSILFGFFQISADLLRAVYRWMQVLSSVSIVISSPCNPFPASFYLLCLKLTLLCFRTCLQHSCTRKSCSHVCVCVCVFMYLCVTHIVYDISVCPAPRCFLAEAQRLADRRDPLSRAGHASDGEGSLSPPLPAAYMGIILQCMWFNSFKRKKKNPFFFQLFERASENGAFHKAWKKKVT